MTTIDSDSESQDSDDGRRFRFETTRKDDTLRLHSQNKRRSSPLSRSSNYRSRSGDRGNHNRKDYEKGKQQQERDRKEDKRKSSKERESGNNKYDGKSNSKESRHTATKGNGKDIKDIDKESKTLIENEKRFSDSRTSNHRDKDYKNSKDFRSRESKNSTTRTLKDTKIRETKDVRDQEVKSPRDRETKSTRDLDTKDSRDRERGPKRSRDTSHDRLSAAKYTHRSSREKYSKIRERTDNRDRSEQLEIERQKEGEERNKTHPAANQRRTLKTGSERKRSIKRDTHSPSKILDQIGSDSETDLGALDPDVGPVMALDTLEDCREMNLSDFDIISDTEGSSSDTQTETKIPAREGTGVKGEMTPHCYGPKITKRVSRSQYKRLVRRQAALNTRRLEELYKVNPRNDTYDSAPLAPSYNNPSAVSDFLLGRDEAVGEAEHRRSLNTDEDTSNYSCKDRENDRIILKENSNENDDSKKLLDRKIYGPSLPPPLEHQNFVPECENTEQTVVENPQVVSPSSFDVRYSSFVDKTSQISIKTDPSESQKTQGKLAKILPSDSCRSVALDVSQTAIIGPSLPPRFAINYKLQKSDSEESRSNTEGEEELVPIIGPSLPPHLKQGTFDSVKTKTQDGTLIQEDNKSSHKSVFGPTLPPHLMTNRSLENNDRKSESDSDEEFFGPLPPDHPAAINDYIQRQLEDRANRMKNKLDAKNSTVDKREEWMIELPSAQASNLGLGNKRQFRNRAGPDMSDRSSWTDTPADKLKKKQDKLLGKLKETDPAEESERLAIQERDKAMEKMAEKHASKKRKESLLEIHKKKLNKKKKKEEKHAKESGKQTRRPFDRDIDLQANRFDEAQKKSILNKAQLLNDRFSRGESKYL